MRGYIPRRDAELLGFAQVFVAGIAAHPCAYGLMPSDVTALEEVLRAYAEAFAVCRASATRTPAAIAAKDGARAALVAVVRGYAQAIKINRGVSREAKVTLGVPVADGVRTRGTVPVTAPALVVLGATPLVHTLGFRDPAAPRARAKPPGAVGLLLFRHVGEKPPESPARAVFVGFVTRQPVALRLAAGDVGRTAYYYGKWVTATGLEGPWSAPAAMTVAA